MGVAGFRSLFPEALRLLAEERRERMNDRAEAARRHKATGNQGFSALRIWVLRVQESKVEV